MRKPVVLGEVVEFIVEPVPAIAVSIALDDNRLGIVAQDVLRCTAEPMQCTFKARDERLGALVIGELDVRVPRVAQFGCERA